MCHSPCVHSGALGNSNLLWTVCRDTRRPTAGTHSPWSCLAVRFLRLRAIWHRYASSARVDTRGRPERGWSRFDPVSWNLRMAYQIDYIEVDPLLSKASLAQRHYLGSFFSDKLAPLLMMRQPFWNKLPCFILGYYSHPTVTWWRVHMPADWPDHPCAFFPQNLSLQISQTHNKNEIWYA